VARLAVAATAPLGADVLERLADRHDVVGLLTRPDRPKGRGRRPGPPPAKETAERLAIPVLQPERLDASLELPADTIVVAAYGTHRSYRAGAGRRPWSARSWRATRRPA